MLSGKKVVQPMVIFFLYSRFSICYETLTNIITCTFFLYLKILFLGFFEQATVKKAGTVKTGASKKDVSVQYRSPVHVEVEDVEVW